MRAFPRRRDGVLVMVATSAIVTIARGKPPERSSACRCCAPVGYVGVNPERMEAGVGLGRRKRRNLRGQRPLPKRYASSARFAQGDGISSRSSAVAERLNELDGVVALRSRARRAPISFKRATIFRARDRPQVP